jgi:hypothetical protein
MKTRPRLFDHDECRRLRAEDPKHWTYRRLGARYGVSQMATCRAVIGRCARDRENQWVWREKNRDAANLAWRCGIGIAQARRILERQVEHQERMGVPAARAIPEAETAP